MDAFAKYEEYCKPKLADLLRSLKLDKEFVWAEGALMRTAEGHEVVDFIGGFGAALLGHNHPEILAEAMELHATYWRNQISALQSQAEEMRTLSTKVTADAAEPIKTQMTRGLD